MTALSLAHSTRVPGSHVNASNTSRTAAASLFQLCKPGRRLQETEEERAGRGAAEGLWRPEREQAQPGPGGPPGIQQHPDQGFP